MDSYMPDYINFVNLTKVALELEDCFGRGLYDFLKQLGSQLTDLTLSCSSDADSTNLWGGGQPFELFNIGLRLVRWFCPQVTQLNISGCGLVSNDLLKVLEDGKAEEEKTIRSRGFFQHLRSLIVLTYYDDDVQVQTCEQTLLLETLQACLKLECLSLEGNFSSFLNNRFIANILKKNPLSELKIFDVRGRVQVPLTIEAAKMFIKLPKIRELRMYSWNVNERDFDKLKEEIERKGWDLLVTKKVMAN